MTIEQFVRLRRSPAAQAAVIGATRALEMAFPIIANEPMLNRLGRALAAFVALETASDRVVAVEAA